VVYMTIPAIPSCFVAFFSDPYSPFKIFNFFILLVYFLFCNPFMDYAWGWIVKFHTSSTILHDALVCS